jgi:hypothetical protein
MDLLRPNWNQEKPDFLEVGRSLVATEIRAIELESPILAEFLTRLRKNHDNGGTYLFCFEIGPSSVYDWYTSRNRWGFDGLIDTLLEHPAILSQLQTIKATKPIASGLASENPFLLDGYFAARLHSGGAYSSPQGDGREEKEFAITVCNELFGLRYGEVSCEMSYAAWTPWFHGIAWDMTITIFDKRFRRIWIFVITDTD